jgi:hypothetical protein
MRLISSSVGPLGTLMIGPPLYLIAIFGLELNW